MVLTAFDHTLAHVNCIQGRGLKNSLYVQSLRGDPFKVSDLTSACVAENRQIYFCTSWLFLAVAIFDSTSVLVLLKIDTFILHELDILGCCEL
jgi:hypothetical protein